MPVLRMPEPKAQICIVRPRFKWNRTVRMYGSKEVGYSSFGKLKLTQTGYK